MATILKYFVVLMIIIVSSQPQVPALYAETSSTHNERTIEINIHAEIIVFQEFIASFREWEIGALIWMYSRKYNVSPYFARAVLNIESSQRNVVSWAGAVGYMQLMPDTADKLNKILKLRNEGKYVTNKDLFDAKFNIECGVYFLHRLTKKYSGDLVQIVVHYNSGTRWINNKDRKLPVETVNYFSKLFREMKTYNFVLTWEEVYYGG